MKSDAKTKTVTELNGAGLLDHPELKELIRYAQIFPASMMQALASAAAAKGISIELELASRLLATFVEPEALAIEPLSQKILNRTFSLEDAERECKLNHERWLYPYELKRLELFLEFHGKLPRKFKESFTLIDAKQETGRILAEMRKRKEGRDHEE